MTAAVDPTNVARSMLSRRFRAPHGATLAVVAALGVGAAVATAFIRTSLISTPSLVTALLLLGSWSYVLCGIAAWRVRPWSGLGPVMCATGFAVLIVQYQLPALPVPVLYAAGWLAGLPILLLAWLILAYPTGRLETWPRRLVIGAGALLVLPFGFLFNGPYARQAALTGQALTLVVAVMGLARFVSTSGRTRRMLAPVPFASLVFALEAVRVSGVVLGFLDFEEVEVLGWFVTGLHPLIPAAFLAGLLSTRWARGGVGELVVELERTPEPGRLRDVLARALRDPGLEVGYPVDGGYVDGTGRELRLTGEDDDRVTTLVEGDDGPLAVLVHDPALVEERDLVTAVAAAARLALANERLQAEVRAQLAEVRASRERIVEAADDERRRIERNLHDGAQQRLVSLNLSLRMLQRRATAVDRALSDEVGRAADDLHEAIDELREIARGVHPPLLTEEGLGPALEGLAERTALPVELAPVPDVRLSSTAEVTAYYVVAEGLTNVAKHARATVAQVDMTVVDNRLVIEVRDDGRGGADLGTGTGLRGLSDRVAAVGGVLSLESPRGHGTCVRVELPCG